MLRTQRVVYLPLKFSVRTDLIRRLRASFRFHRPKSRKRSQGRHFAFAGFSNYTGGVIRDLSFEGPNQSTGNERDLKRTRSEMAADTAVVTVESSRVVLR